MSKKNKGARLSRLKALQFALFPALIITALPYLTYLTKLPFTRNEMRVLCWFFGEVVVGEIWQLASNATGEDIGGTRAFYVVSQACNVVLGTIFFYICLRTPSKLDER